jgi:hypothetical protein
MNKKEILKLAMSMVESSGTYPTVVELAKVGISRDRLRASFGSLEGLCQEIATTSDSILDLQRSKLSNRTSTKAKRFVITTAVTEAPVDIKFYKSLKTYCRKFDAELIVLVSVAGKNMLIDPILRDETIVVQDTRLNDNVSILGIKSGAKRADPVTGLPRIGQRNGTFICPSPKQRLKYVATGPSALPHALMSTGALTKPNYLRSNILVDQSNYVAHNDHVMGAVIVELVDQRLYHFRQIQADASGMFYDLGTKVSGNLVKQTAPSHLVLGDWHSGETCPTVVKATTSLSDKLKIPNWVIHDGYNGTSISHHDEGKLLTLAVKANYNKLSLKDELETYAKDIAWISKKVNVIVVASNHDEHLDRYLNEGRYVNHPYNHRLSLELAMAYLDEKSPVEYFTRNYLKHMKLSNVRWLKRDESYQVGGVELGAHGDKGANGSRGGIASMENAYSQVVFGHSHTPQILRGAWCVGTSTPPAPDYGTGPSSWMNTHCLVYDNGMRQLINLINGSFTTRKL